MTTTNTIVANALAAMQNAKIESDTPIMLKAYRDGCKKSCELIASTIAKLWVYKTQMENIHKQEPARFQRAVDTILKAREFCDIVRAWD